MNLEHNLTIEQRQELVMTPELIQSIKILQYNAKELDHYIQEQLQSNPVLEQKEIDWQEFLKNRSKDNIGQKYWDSMDPDQQENEYEQYTTAEESLLEHLMFQLEVSVRSKELITIGEYLLESLDENGYLTVSIKEAAASMNTTTDKIKYALRVIHTFEPYGVGARNLKECLMIQLHHIGILDNNYRKLLSEHLEDLSANRLKRIAKSMELGVTQIQEMADVIRKLDPKPGLQFAPKGDNRYITPEIFIEEQDGQFVAVLNDNSSPQLMISSYYESMLNEAENDPEVLKYLKKRLDSANWLITSINKRKETIRKVAQAIVAYQQDFFRHGHKYLKTLTLKQIASAVDIHESTVSRTINGKYLQCSEGVFELKYFFSSGIGTAEDGTGISSKSIKVFMKEMIEREDSKHPISDQKIADVLNSHGVNISRRTVAKYRDEMHILSSSRRKRY